MPISLKYAIHNSLSYTNLGMLIDIDREFYWRSGVRRNVGGQMHCDTGLGQNENEGDWKTEDT